MAHELTHLRSRQRNGILAILVIPAILFMPGPGESLQRIPGFWIGAQVFLIAAMFVTLAGIRRREFAADAGAVALCGDRGALFNALYRIGQINDVPLHWPKWAEWFATHPSTDKRLARLAGIPSLALEKLEAPPEPTDHYSMEPEAEPGFIFHRGWQAANGGRYGWAIYLCAGASGMVGAIILARIPDAGLVHLLIAVILACGFTKFFASAAMGASYARLAAKLQRKLAVEGILAGFAPGSTPLVYGNYRYMDAGLLRFEGAHLIYRSERIQVDLAASDITQVTIVPAAPSAWLRNQPCVHFRDPRSGAENAFILHPLAWGATGGRLRSKIERWREQCRNAATGASRIEGWPEIKGEPYQPIGLRVLARAFIVPGGIAMFGSLWATLPALESVTATWWALTLTAAAYAYMVAPAMFYRPPAGVPGDKT